ncbi:MAG: IclR family transcriptional regulator C-terminal domain-containing protein [Rhodospirillaceae bacterium]|nr:IclR family transcriptional regulator C-terminal domain-containing protein [Rhodospirillaceae bacterium]
MARRTATAPRPTKKPSPVKPPSNRRAPPDKRIVQAFDRGLDVLAFLNLRNGASIGDVAKGTGINRGTVYRLLETLRRKGMIRKDERDHCYWLAAAVRNLSDGFAEEAWIERLVKPRIAALTKEFVWPVSFCTPSHSTMLVRANSDYDSPLTLQRYPVGHRVSMIGSAVGQAYLAACEPAQRDALIAALRQIVSDPGDRAALQKESFQRHLDEVRRKGFALVGNQSQRISGLAVPVRGGQAVIGAISLRFFSSAMSQNAAIARFVPRLSACAAGISTALAGE